MSVEIGFDKFCEIADTVSAISCEVVNRTFRSASLRSRKKHDRSLVSEADEAIEREVEAVIRDAFPSHGILGEEFSNQWPQEEYVWTIDPIDGTTPFVFGVPMFGTLVGLVRRGEPCFGAICLPTWKQTLVGDCHTAFCNGEVISVDGGSCLEDAVLLTSDLTELIHVPQRKGFESLVEQVYIARTWGDCFGYAMVARGEASIMMDAGLNAWDIAPLVPILCGAGAKVTDFEGNPVTDGSGRFSTSCLAASPALHAEVVRRLRLSE
jgi:histidinol phosphatase-like enzyme (inositol monophosphatase family)